ncbi:MAG: hypothetical protein GW906_02845, partial [Epsilonproteobacteria bacterium]|nr:hypothetical protein [Campylobacterota bacterium]
TTKPTIAITTNNNALKDADVATITFTLSEASTDFTFADVTAVGGTLSNFTATSATVYTASFTPTAGSTTGATIDVAADTFTDAVGNTNSAATQLSMATIDEAPVLVTVSNLSAQDEEFSDFNITLQASDAEGDAYSFSATSNDVSKSTVNVVGNQLVVSSVANANGNVSINVIVTQDNNASLVDGQTITFNINPVNDAPTIDTTFSDITLLEDNLTTNYELNVSDIEGSDLNITVDSNDTAILQVTQNWTNLVQQATWANQALDFNLTTVANANGIVRITITADDSDKNSTRSFDVNVTAVNDAPTSDDLNITINEDTTKTFSNSDFTFTDVDAGATLSSISITTLPTAGTLQLNNVDVTLNQTISTSNIVNLLFTPAANANGTPYATFGFTVNDGDANSTSVYTASINVAAVDDAPILGTITNQSITEDGTDLNITLSATDIEGDTITYTTSSSNTSIATVSIVNGKLVVSPIANANGTITVDVNATANGQSSIQTFDLSITAVNDAPTIDTTFSDITLLKENLTTNYELNVSDIEGSDLNITVDSNDTAILQVTQNWTNLVQQATWANQALDFNLTTVANANGIVRITITADDSDKNSTRSFDVNVTAVNDAPTSDDLNITINEDTTKTFSNSDFTFTDVDAGATLSSISITTLPTAGTLQLNNVDVTLNQTISTSNIVNLLFTPAANANGTPYATFGFTVNDGDANSTSVYTASINVAAVDDAPILGTITNQSITEDGTDLNITLSATDIEGDTITYTTSSSNTSIATVSIVNGKLVVSPIANANGTITVDVNATANGQSSIQTFDLSITAVNDAPTIDTTFSDITLLKENLTTNYELNVSDIEGSDLNITVDSNDTAILQVTQNWTNLVQQATWANQALDFNLTTVANANGIVRITITADDSDKNSTRSFDVTVLDGTPDPISFTPKINQALSSVIDSQSVAIRGIAYALPISIINGEYKIGNGAWLSTAGVINNDENVTLRQTSSSSYATTTTTTLTVGDINASFDVTTLADPTPTVSSTQLVTSSADSVATGVTASSGGAGSDVSPYEITYDDGSGTPSRVTINNIPGKTITFVPSSVASEYRLDNAVASYNNNATVEHLVTVGTKETKAISELSKAEVQFTADGGVETTLTNGGESIAVKANADGTAEHLVTVNGVTTKATSNVVGATTMIKTNGNVETAAPTTQADEIIGSDTWVHEALVKTDANGKTVTTFQKRNTTTDEVTDAKNTFDPQTPYNAGSTVVIEEINGKTYIKTTAEVTTNLSVE